MNDNERNDLQIIITHVLQEMEEKTGEKSDFTKVNLAERNAGRV